MSENTITLYSASWCGPCHALKARLQRESINVDIRSIDDNDVNVNKFGIKSVPTLVVESGDSYIKISGSEDIYNFLKQLHDSPDA